VTAPRTSSVDTLAVHAGRDDCAALGVHTPPLDLSSTAPLLSVEASGAAYDHMAQISGR
jgi:methionine-gamma-lyase